MKIFSKFPTVNISKLNYWLVICSVKNLISTTLKMIFSIFRFFLHPQIPDFQILSYHNKPYINGKIIYSAFRWCINLNFNKMTLMTGLVDHGHKLWFFFWLNSDHLQRTSGQFICVALHTSSFTDSHDVIKSTLSWITVYFTHGGHRNDPDVEICFVTHFMWIK